MSTTSSSRAGKASAPSPERAPEQEQAQQGNNRNQGAGNGHPAFVPPHVERRQQRTGQQPVPTRDPNGARRLPAQPPRGAAGTHTPRGLGAASGRPARQNGAGSRRSAAAATGSGAGASFTGNVLGQFSANYPDDAWFYDGNLGSWVQIDPAYDSGVMLINEVVSLARAHMLTLYYDTDTSGMVVDVYAF